MNPLLFIHVTTTILVITLENKVECITDYDDQYSFEGYRKYTFKPPHHEQKGKWVIYVTAGPTVLIFILCVIAISIKIYQDGEALDPTTAETVSPMLTLLKPKPKINEMYDRMLDRFREKKDRERGMVERKCSQIQIQGVVSGSPKSLARKHLIISKLNNRNTTDDDAPSKVAKEILRTSVKEVAFTVDDGITYLDEIDEIFLPEDLEDLEYWEESYI